MHDRGGHQSNGGHGYAGCLPISPCATPGYRSTHIYMHRPATLGAMYEDGPLSHFDVTGLQPVTHHKRSWFQSCLNYFLYIKSNPGCLFVLSGKLRIFSFKYVFGNFVSVPSKQAGLFNQIKLIVPLLVRTSWGGPRGRLSRGVFYSSQGGESWGKSF